MAATFAWSFPTLDVVYNQDGFANVVKTVHWRYTGVDGAHSAASYGTVSLDAPGQSFTDFEELTADLVTGWVEAALGEERIAQMEAALEAQIAGQKAPKTGSVPPPWQA